MTISLLSERTVHDVRDLVVKEPALVPPSCSIDGILGKIVENPASRHVYVVDRNGVLTGAIRMNVVIDHILPYAALRSRASRTFIDMGHLNAQDLMDPSPFSVTAGTRLDEVLDLMRGNRINELPVVDGNGRVVGEINIMEIITGYLNGKGGRQPREDQQ